MKHTVVAYTPGVAVSAARRAEIAAALCERARLKNERIRQADAQAKHKWNTELAAISAKPPPPLPLPAIIATPFMPVPVVATGAAVAQVSSTTEFQDDVIEDGKTEAVEQVDNMTMLEPVSSSQTVMETHSAVSETVARPVLFDIGTMLSDDNKQGLKEQSEDVEDVSALQMESEQVVSTNESGIDITMDNDDDDNESIVDNAVVVDHSEQSLVDLEQTVSVTTDLSQMVEAKNNEMTMSNTEIMKQMSTVQSGVIRPVLFDVPGSIAAAAHDVHDMIVEERFEKTSTLSTPLEISRNAEDEQFAAAVPGATDGVPRPLLGVGLRRLWTSVQSFVTQRAEEDLKKLQKSGSSLGKAGATGGIVGAITTIVTMKK